MLVCLYRRRFVRCLCFLLEKTTFELNFSAMEDARCSAMRLCFTHCVIMARFDTSHRREATSLIMNLFRELLQVVNRIVTKSLRVVSGMLKVTSLVLIHVPS